MFIYSETDARRLSFNAFNSRRLQALEHTIWETGLVCAHTMTYRRYCIDVIQLME